jgi:hypothetical protein
MNAGIHAGIYLPRWRFFRQHRLCVDKEMPFL